NESGKSRRHVRPSLDVFDDSLKIKKMIEHHKSEKMKHDIEEGKQAKHPPEFDKIIPTGDLAQGRYAQACQQKDQRPGAGKVGDEFNGIGREIIGEAMVKKLAEREQAGEEDNDLEARKHGE